MVRTAGKARTRRPLTCGFGTPAEDAGHEGVPEVGDLPDAHVRVLRQRDGTLFAALGNPSESRFYRVNPSTGAATLIGSIGFPGVSGIRFFVPPPGPLAIAKQGELVRLSWPHVRGGVLETAGTVTGTWSIVIR